MRSHDGPNKPLRRRPRLAAILAIAAAIGATPPALAQEAQANLRDGQWLGVGLGAGLDQVSCDICSATPNPGLSGYLRFGGTLSQRLLVGGEFNGWTHKEGGEDDGGARQYLGALHLVAYWYTRPDGSFFLKGGLGPVGFRSEADGDALTSLSLGGQFGIGFERRISGNLSVTPFANLIVAPFSSLSFNGDQAADGVTVSLLKRDWG